MQTKKNLTRTSSPGSINYQFKMYNIYIYSDGSTRRVSGVAGRWPRSRPRRCRSGRHCPPKTAVRVRVRVRFRVRIRVRVRVMGQNEGVFAGVEEIRELLVVVAEG